jgi:ribosomal-protein-alanine N-acetyltransferase
LQEIIIRKVSKKDLNAIYEIERLSFRRPYPNGFLKTLYTIYSNHFLIAEKNGQPVGYILATHTHNNGHIISIAVHPSVRRKGIGKKLLTTLEEALNKLGVTLLRLEVRKSNILAQHFYEELDFTFSYTIEHYYNDEDGLVYYKTL